MKEKIENFWYHYKVHTIVGLLLVFCAVALLAPTSERKKPDLKMVYFSDIPIASQSKEEVNSDLTKNSVVRDINGDGEVLIYFDEIVCPFDADAQMDEVTMSKIQTVAYAGDHTLLLAHEYALEDYDGSYADISHKAKKGDKTYTGPLTKTVTGISVEGNTYLEEMGIDTSNLYVAMRLMPEKEKKKGETLENFRLAYEVMDYVLSFNEVEN